MKTSQNSSFWSVLRAHPWMEPAGIFLFALTIRGLHLFSSSRDITYTVPLIDSLTYATDALRLLRGQGFTDHPLWQGPLYPLFMTIPFAVRPGSALLTGSLQCFIGAFSCLLTLKLGKLALGSRWGVVPALLQCVHPMVVFFDVELLPPVIVLPLLLAGSLLSLTAPVRPVVRCIHRFASGVCLALCALAAPSCLLLSIALIASLLLSRGLIREKGLAMALVILGHVATILPVTLWNRHSSGHWVPISTNGGINFYIGNNPRSLETQCIRPGIEWQALRREPVGAGITTPDAMSAYFYDKSFRWMQSHPGQALSWFVSKMFLCLNQREIVRNRDFYQARKSSPVLWLIPRPFALFFPWAILALFMGRRTLSDPLKLSLLMLGAALVTGVLFFPATRYRHPGIPFLLILACWGMKLVAKEWHRGAKEKICISLALCLVFLFTNIPPPFPSNQFLNRTPYNVADALQRLGRNAESAAWYRRCLKEGVAFLDSLNGLAICENQAGHAQRAELLWQHLTRSYPGAFEGFYNLGLSLMKRGEFRQAAEAFARAKSLDPTMSMADQYLSECLNRMWDSN